MSKIITLAVLLLSPLAYSLDLECKAGPWSVINYNEFPDIGESKGFKIDSDTKQEGNHTVTLNKEGDSIFISSNNGKSKLRPVGNSGQSFVEITSTEIFWKLLPDINRQTYLARINARSNGIQGISSSIYKCK